MSYRTITSCRICGNKKLDSLLHLGDQALTGVFPRTREEPVLAGPLELVKCSETASTGAEKGCGLVQLHHSYDPNALYGQNYGYRSGLNASMVRHLGELVKHAQEIARPEAGDLVLDIGSNDGTLLGCYPKSVETVGMDPTGKKYARFYAPHVKLIPDFFSADAFLAFTKGRRAKIVTSIAMFYDLEQPLAFMGEIGRVLADDGIWMFEQSYLPELLSHNAYDTICHEHLSYYALRQISWMTDRAGLEILDVQVTETNGGSFCVIAGKRGARHPADKAAVERVMESERAARLDTEAPFLRFRDDVFRHRDELVKTLRHLRGQKKRVFGYGASTKGNVILQFCKFTPDDLPAIAEVNEDKFGAFTPRTLIPIKSEAEVHALNPDYLVVLPWHFRANTLQREAAFLARGGQLIFPLPRIEVV